MTHLKKLKLVPHWESYPLIKQWACHLQFSDLTEKVVEIKLDYDSYTATDNGSPIAECINTLENCISAVLFACVGEGFSTLEFTPPLENLNRLEEGDLDYTAHYHSTLGAVSFKIHERAWQDAAVRVVEKGENYEVC